MCAIDDTTPVGTAFRDKLRSLYKGDLGKDQVIVRYCRNVRCVRPECMRAVNPAPQVLYPLDLLQVMVEDYIDTVGVNQKVPAGFVQFYTQLFQDVQKDHWLEKGLATKSAVISKVSPLEIKYTLDKSTFINNPAVTAEFGY